LHRRWRLFCSNIKKENGKEIKEPKGKEKISGMAERPLLTPKSKIFTYDSLEDILGLWRVPHVM